MVTRLIVLFAASALLCSAASVREYQVGDKAKRQIKTPVPLVVVDAAATESLRQREAQRVHVIFRFFPHAASEAEAAFRSTFVRTRTNFLAAVQVRFGKSVLTPEEIVSPEFQRFRIEFQRQNILFPVGSSLARLWTLGESDAEVEARLVSKLRGAMSGYVRPEVTHPDIWVGSTIRLVSAADNEKITAQLVDDRGFNVAKTNFVSIQRTKTDLLNSFPAEERTIGKYLASFVKPNCEMEADLTRTLREQRTSGLLIADRYEAGQVLVARGQEIDENIRAALDEMNSRLAQATHMTNASTGMTAFAARHQNALLILGGIAALSVIWGVARIRRGRHSAELLPPLAHHPLQRSGSSEAEWRARALYAEQQAARTREMVRTGLLARLATWMADKLTQKLAHQSTQLMDTQQKAAAEVAELGARLEKVQAPLQERLAAYESRIAELEKELVIKDEENRQLIEAKIHVIRKQLELERDKNHLKFN